MRRVFTLFATGVHTIDSVCDTLHAEGRTFRETRPKFPRACIYNILLDRAYLGEVEYQGQWHACRHEPLVERANHQSQDRQTLRSPSLLRLPHHRRPSARPGN